MDSSAPENEHYYYNGGNIAYKEGNVDRAVELYSCGLKVDQGKIDTTLKCKLYANRAQCWIRQREYDSAISDCSQVLALDNGNSKILLRRANAYENIGCFDKAITDMNRVLDLINCSDSSNKVIPIISTEKCIKQLSYLKSLWEKDQRTIQAEGCPHNLITAEQHLRLYFMTEYPRIIHLSGDDGCTSDAHSYHVRLAISNEFGLWSRDILTWRGGVASPASLTKVNGSFVPIDGIAKDNGVVSPGSVTAVFTDGVIDGGGKVDITVTFESKALFANGASAASSIPNRSSGAFNVTGFLQFECSGVLPSGASVVPLLSLPVMIQVGVETFETVKTALSLNLANSCNSQQQSISEHDIMELGADLSASSIRKVVIKCSQEVKPTSISLYALECAGQLGIGGKVWDSTYVLLQFLQRYPQIVRDKRVIELGSGTGLAGIAIVPLCPSHVTLTDMLEVVPLIQENICLNALCALATVDATTVDVRECLRDRYVALEHMWGTSLINATGDDNTSDGEDTNSYSTMHSYVKQCDVLVCSDVVYDPIGYEPLAKSIRSFLHTMCDSDSGDDQINQNVTSLVVEGIDPIHTKCCVMAHRHRHPEDQKFFDLLYAAGDLTVVKSDYQYTASDEAGCGDGDVCTLQDVEIWYIALKACCK